MCWCFVHIGKCYLEIAGWKISELGQGSLLPYCTDFQFIIIIIIIIICLSFMELYNVYWSQKFWKVSKEICSITSKLFFPITLSDTLIYLCIRRYKTSVTEGAILTKFYFF